MVRLIGESALAGNNILELSPLYLQDSNPD